MVYIAGAAIFYLFFVLVLRRKAAEQGIIAVAFQKENEWGLGQIIALFSWVPLLIELAIAAINTFRNKDPPCTCVSCKEQRHSVLECRRHQREEGQQIRS